MDKNGQALNDPGASRTRDLQRLGISSSVHLSYRASLYKRRGYFDDFELFVNEKSDFTQLGKIAFFMIYLYELHHFFLTGG